MGRRQLHLEALGFRCGNPGLRQECLAQNQKLWYIFRMNNSAFPQNKTASLGSALLTSGERRVKKNSAVYAAQPIEKARFARENPRKSKQRGDFYRAHDTNLKATLR